MQCMGHASALRAWRDQSLRVFSLLGVKMTPKSEKTLDLWLRQARSAEARPILYRELNGYKMLDMG